MLLAGKRKEVPDTSGLAWKKRNSLGMWKRDRIFAASGLCPQGLAHSKDSLNTSGTNQRDKAQVPLIARDKTRPGRVWPRQATWRRMRCVGS